MNHATKEQVQAILESIVPSDWVQEDTEEDLENAEKKNTANACRD